MAERMEVSGLDRVEQVLRLAYGSARLVKAGEAQVDGLTLVSTELGPIRLDRLSLGMSVRTTLEPTGALVFKSLRRGRTSYTSPGQHRTYTAGEVLLAAQPDQRYTAAVDDVEADVMLMDVTLLDQVARPAGEDGRVRFTGEEAVSPAAAEHWRATFTYVWTEALANPELAQQQLVAGHAARLLAATTLATFPNTALTEPTATDRNDAQPAALRRAISFIESNVDRDIAADDIAAASYVTLRALQLAFRRHLGTTPMAYLRQVRLQHARDELLRMEPEKTTVTAVANRWGFLNASTFAAHYRDAFSELPSSTLRR